MKKLLYILLILSFSSIALGTMTRMRVYHTITGEGEGVLDGTPFNGNTGCSAENDPGGCCTDPGIGTCETLVTGDAAIVIEADGDEYRFIYNSTDTDAERAAANNPVKIRAGAYSSGGVWSLVHAAKTRSLIPDDLNDVSTPHVLLEVETINVIISNYDSSGANRVFTMPAAHVAGNIIFVIGDDFNVDIEPVAGTNFYLNGIAMANDEHIQNTAGAYGNPITGYVVDVEGVLHWFFFGGTNWVEATE